MYKHILFPVDLTQESSWKTALPVVIEYARAFDSQLHVVAVVPDFGMSIVGQFFPKDFEKRALEATNKQLHEFVDKHVPTDIAVQHIVTDGTVYEQILRLAEKLKIDLIVIAAHRPELKDYLLGPNAARVVRHAVCSVLVVRD
ncbi:MAG: universal stress protein [Alphaproteobacteria bacterium]|nr:universal stress protein [Alphaproteobacteria bacterium]MBU0796883.1 universal stress protein [Alphaproteobacteria bacterium]MBU0886921.1 universal stress protein [Alphaproteobacteria bacterium]MBU1813223.1 universal stress protein [Alphaproteobacteria bacterium]MBU2091054.1 universal stress protein [Alphaproteobacteria bacterium]